MRVFFSSEDYSLYLKILDERCRRNEVAIWSYCLLPNHVHLIAAPSSAEGLGRALGEAHRKYATCIHRREEWTGHLWQQRFFSCPLEERHLFAALRYVIQNPSRAGLIQNPVQWKWSSARAHLGLEVDPLIDPAPLARRALDWKRIVSLTSSAEEVLSLRQATRAGFWKEPSLEVPTGARPLEAWE